MIKEEVMEKRIKWFSQWTILIILLVAFIGCATLQQKWDKATDDEKARITISQTQKSLKNLFNAGKIFVELKPQYITEWKEKVIPAFDVANKVLADLIAKGNRGEKLLYLDVIAAIGTKANDIQKLLTAWGVKL